MKQYLFEICANSAESCLAAQQGGAHRVELCASMPEGGTTPSYGEIRLARRLIDIRLHVIIRPRGGDFLYSPLELDIMEEDIRMARLGKDQHGGMGLHRGDQVLVFPGDIQDLDLFQVHLGVLGVILEPGQNVRIAEQLLFHRASLPHVSASVVLVFFIIAYSLLGYNRRVLRFSRFF